MKRLLKATQTFVFFLNCSLLLQPPPSSSLGEQQQQQQQQRVYKKTNKRVNKKVKVERENSLPKITIFRAQIRKNNTSVFVMKQVHHNSQVFGTTHEKEKHRTHAFGIAATVRDHRRCDHCYWWHPIRRARVTHGET